MRGPPGPTGGSALFWSAIINAAASYYAENFYAVASAVATSRPSNRIVLPSGRNFKGLQVWLTASPSKSVTATLYKGSIGSLSATALAVTIGSGVQYGEELTTAVAANGGDVVSLLLSHTSGAPFTGRAIAYLGEG